MASSRSPGHPTASAWPTPRRRAPSGSSSPSRAARANDRRADPDRAPLGRAIRRADWRWDEAGHVDRWEHLFVVAARPGGRSRRLTQGDWGVRQASWDPTGRSLVYVADRTETADLYPRPSVWRVGLDDAQSVEILALGGPASHPAISPDGRWLAAVGVIDPDALDDVSPGIVIAPADGSGPATALAPALDRPIGWALDTDLVGWQATSRGGPFWAGNDRLIALVSDRGPVPRLAIRPGPVHRPGDRSAPADGPGRGRLRAPGGVGRRPADRPGRDARRPGARGDDGRMARPADPHPDRLRLAGRRSPAGDGADRGAGRRAVRSTSGSPARRESTARFRR